MNLSKTGIDTCYPFPRLYAISRPYSFRLDPRPKRLILLVRERKLLCQDTKFGPRLFKIWVLPQTHEATPLSGILCAPPTKQISNSSAHCFCTKRTFPDTSRTIRLKIFNNLGQNQNKSESDIFTSGKTSAREYHPSEISTPNSA